jgi:hypothetical protein
VPERLREFVNKDLSLEADILEQVVAELAQLPPRTGARTTQSNSGDELPDHLQWRDMPSVGAALFRSREWQRESKCSGAP